MWVIREVSLVSSGAPEDIEIGGRVVETVVK